MKSLFYVIFLFVGLLGCQKEPLASSQTKLSLNFQCNEIEITKKLSSSQEREVKDINIYLFNKSTGNVTKEYITNTTNLSLTLVKGEYDVYVIANCGYNLGSKTKTEIENFRFSISNELDLEDGSVLLMTAQETVYVNGDTYLSVILKRLVARVDVNISTEFDFTLNSVSVINAPNNCYAMIGNVSNSGFNYAPSRSSSFSFYMFENLAGENLSIKNERQKNKDTAPLSATYIHIIGSYEDKKVEYTIYLGENNSTDFNVSRNKNYSFLINLKGVNEVDSRVNIANLTVSPLNESYSVGETTVSTINLNCTDNNNSQYSIAYYLEEGDGDILINKVKQNNGVFTTFLNYGENAKSATLSYTQNSISKVRIRIVCKDQNNFTFSRTLTTSYLKTDVPLEITTPIGNESRGGSKSTVSFTAIKKDYTGTVQLKYELLSGVGTFKYNGITLNNGIYSNAMLGDNNLEFTPLEPIDTKARITVKLADGETASQEFTIKVSKIEILGLAEGWRAGGEIYLLVDEVQNGILPVGSCEKFETTKRCYYRYITYPYSSENEQDMSMEYEITRPNNKLKTAFDYFGQDEEEGDFVCYCHGYTYKYRYTTIEFKVYSPNKFYDFKFYYD